MKAKPMSLILSRQVRIVLCMLGLFVFSNISIVAGYYNTRVGVSLIPVGWVYESIPVIKTSFVLTLLLPINIVIAFFHSKAQNRGQITVSANIRKN